MDTATIVLSVISVLGTVSSIFFAIVAFRRNEKGDNKKDGMNEGVLISDIGYIKSSIDRIEKSMDKLEERYDLMQSRLIKIETELSDHIKNKTLHNIRSGGK